MLSRELNSGTSDTNGIFQSTNSCRFFLQEVVAFSFWASVDTVLYTILVYTADFILRETRN